MSVKTIHDQLERLTVCEPSSMETGCWEWPGKLDQDGYARVQVDGKTAYLHRASYKHFVGPIPDGMVIDHLCRNPKCCNFEHLEVVTPGENLRRGFSLQAINARKTHCKNGHPFDDENTVICEWNGWRMRQCKICRRVRDLAGYHRRKKAALAQAK